MLKAENLLSPHFFLPFILVATPSLCKHMFVRQTPLPVSIRVFAHPAEHHHPAHL